MSNLKKKTVANLWGRADTPHSGLAVPAGIVSTPVCGLIAAVGYLVRKYGFNHDNRKPIWYWQTVFRNR
jgi:hypothetical protein